MSRKLYTFKETQTKIKWHDKHTEKLRITLNTVQQTKLTYEKNT